MLNLNVLSIFLSTYHWNIKKKKNSRLGALNGNKATCTFTFVIKILASNLINNFEVVNKDFVNFWGIAWSHTVNKHVFA